MARVRLLGPRDRLPVVLETLQDFGRLQLDRIPQPGVLTPVDTDERTRREQRAAHRVLADAEAAADALGISVGAFRISPAHRSDLAHWARRARRWRLQAESIRRRRNALEDERTLLARYRDFLEAFRVLLRDLADAPHLRAFGVTIPGSERDRVNNIADALRDELDVEVIVTSRQLPSGDLAVLIAVPVAARERIEHAFGAAKIAEVPLPAGYTGASLTEAAPKILARLSEIPGEAAKLSEDRAALAAQIGPELRLMVNALRDRLAADHAAELSYSTPHAFAIEGWVPESDVTKLGAVLEQRQATDVVLETLDRREWVDDNAPVVLSNPRIFRPFETLTSMLPLPRYGSIDPTPFLAVGFPLFFGIMLGDIGYGLALAWIVVIVRRRASEQSMLRALADIALPCAVFSVIFGILFGELFGSLGRTWFGIKPVLFDREEAFIAAMVLAVAVGVVHTLLGLLLGAVSERRHPRIAISRGVQFVMILLIVAAGLSLVNVLPDGLFGPLAISLFIGLPVLLALEGIVAPIEFLSTVSSVLSYVRIMALGTASVMLAVIANDMVGLAGSAVVGVLLALLFHLVNFALGLFSPTVHALRLHYVEFFKQFFTPGGRPYQPFRHAAASADAIKGDKS
jgi:V/A-type H+-transporting ATPase subunit I